MPAISAVEVIHHMPVADRDQLLAHFKALDPREAGTPNIYRVKAQGGRWQCEWNDLTEVGAFRSRWLGRAVKRAQIARVRYLIAALEAADE